MPISKTSDRVTLTHPNGSTAEILLYGATVISWKSRVHGDDAAPPSERLFVSSKAVLDGSKAVRGGIPVVFPFFGPPTRPEFAQMPQHGFARSQSWSFQEELLDSAAGVSVRLALAPTSALKALHDFPWALTYTVTLAAHQLSTDLAVHHTGASDAPPFAFQALLHTYLAAPAASVRVAPLTGLTFIDKVRGGAENTEDRAEVDVLSFTDRVYKAAGGHYRVRWAGGGADVRATGFNDVVVWNPAAEAGRKMGDMEEGGWDKFVCVEPGAASYWIDLAPGGHWRGTQTITAL